ncbi:MAG: 16S rRNA (guanine(527)-N(7))-methyltransferase RsmG [Rhodospirillales bacterium 20-60-12]|nr:MAG: 16S rRNA (guanine(527)-N(7))-methyltransferase RsmG [Rhodospirillales bacterium 20-60-12]
MTFHVKHPLFSSAHDVSRETLDKLRAYEALVLKWSAKLNLVSARDQSLIWSRHIEDSLALVKLIPADTERAIDIGSGAGFPGLVLAIATGVHFTLIESDQRKAAFLFEAVSSLQINAKILPVRIEAAKLEPAPLVTARALAALPRLLEWATPLLAPGGVFLFPKGRGAEEELTLAAKHWQMKIERFPSMSDPGSLILRLSEVRHVPKA